jgi:hypothetical protein
VSEVGLAADFSFFLREKNEWWELTCQFHSGDHSGFAPGTVYSDTGAFRCTVPVCINLYIFEIYKILKYQKSLTSNKNRRIATWAGLLACIGLLPNSIQETNLIQSNLTAASRLGFRNTQHAPPSPTSRPPVPSSKAPKQTQKAMKKLQMAERHFYDFVACWVGELEQNSTSSRPWCDPRQSWCSTSTSSCPWCGPRQSWCSSRTWTCTASPQDPARSGGAPSEEDPDEPRW